MSPLCFRRLCGWPGAAVAVLLIIACAPAAPDEERIAGRISQMAEALAERNARAFMAPLADDFSADHLGLDRRTARVLLEREMRASERLRARIVELHIELHGQQRASARFQVILTGGSGLIPERARWLTVETGWRLSDDEWMLVNARWDHVAGT